VSIPLGPGRLTLLPMLWALLIAACWGSLHAWLPAPLRLDGRAQGFAMPVRYHNRKSRPDVEFEYAGSLAALAGWADVLVVATTGGLDTHHLIDASVLRSLGANGFLINVARGSVVDEAALIHALQTGVIAGAGLDVYEAEPSVPAALRALENVVLMPHIGSATQQTRQAMFELLVDNLCDWAATKRLRTEVAG